MCLAPVSASADARLVAARAALRAAVDSLAEVDPTEVAGTGLGEAVLELLDASRRLEGITAGITGRFEHSGDWAADGARDALAWLRGRSNHGFGPLRQTSSAARDAAAFPEMAAAVRAGRVDVRHLRILADTARQHPRLVPHLRGAQGELVALAAEREPGTFRRTLAALCYRLDPSDPGRRKETTFFLHASTLMDGHVRVDGLLPADVGALLVSALESARRAQPRDIDPESTGASHTSSTSPSPATPDPGTPDVFGNPITAPEPVDARRTSQRNVEALHRILSLAASASGAESLSAVAGLRPRVHVTIPLDTLTAAPGDGVDCGWLDRFGVPHQPLHPDTARRLACDASLRPLILHPDGTLAAYGRATERIPSPLRSYVTRRDRHCRFAGCRARIDEIHHVVYYSRGGSTTSDNLLGLCWHHHHLVHEGGWQLQGDANADIKGESPDGRTWTTGPPGG